MISLQIKNCWVLLKECPFLHFVAYLFAQCIIHVLLFVGCCLRYFKKPVGCISFLIELSLCMFGAMGEKYQYPRVKNVSAEHMCNYCRGKILTISQI